MRSTYCLGQFITPISPSLPTSHNHVPQVGLLQRGRARVHVYCSPQERVGDLSARASEHLGPLLGPVSTCLAPVTGNEISPHDVDIMKVRAFVVNHHRVRTKVWGCVFSRSEHISHIQAAFAAAGVDLTPIWNYNPSLFFDIPHYVVHRDVNASQAWLVSAIRQCRTNLHPHQLAALDFLRKNESASNNTMQLWRHPTNAWIHSSMGESGSNNLAHPTPTTQGSILADNMGLGKTLTTLAYVLATQSAWWNFTAPIG
ncbi:hypothetical protein PTTG_27651 [Puccinia triticina 1-1 BBBD Race 1]|uniref:SNF2_N domain-containing protein n=1 Tax=Puccinia triticina (isolate 1-1 / race 1 (BBBD)) TaxID=630390 RepID=A0A180GIT4_PUCT1|nr:hypothetical protein PTTG_27651 [Puccinia triticina 1-1 BBBD Race 1]